MAGRKRTPIELVKLKGADKKNPQRYRTKPPKSQYGLGDPPKHMTKEAKEVWKEIEKNAPAGVLTGAERFTMEMVSTLMAEYRNPDSEGFNTSKLSLLHKMFGDLGMNPIDRQRLGVIQADKPKTPENDVDDFSAFRK